MRRAHAQHPARWLAWGLWSSVALFLGVAAFFILATLSVEIPQRGFGFRGWVPVVSILWATIGARIASRQPRNAVGWLVLTCGWLWAVTSMFEEYATFAYVARDLSMPLVQWVIWFNTLTPALVAGCSGLTMLLLPDGRLPSRRWVAAAATITVATGLVTAGYAFVPRQLTPIPFENPLSLAWFRASSDLVSPLMDVLYVLRGLIVLLPTGALILRLRVARGDRRRQLTWIATAGTIASLAFYLNALVRNNSWIQLAEIVALAYVPIAFAIAITRYRLYDIDVILDRAFVYGGASGILAALYVGALEIAQRLFVATTGQRSDAAIVMTTLAAAALFTPLKERLAAIVGAWARPPIAGAFGLSAFRGELELHLRMNDPDRLLTQLLTECVAAYESRGGALQITADGESRIVQRIGHWTGDAEMSMAIGGPRGMTARILLGPRLNGAGYTEAQCMQLRGTARLVNDVMANLTTEAARYIVGAK